MPLFADAVAAFRSRTPSRSRSSDVWEYPRITSHGDITLANGGAATYSAIYTGQPWVFAATNKLATSLARMPLKVYTRRGQAKAYQTTGRLYELIQQPYPHVTPFHHKERIVRQAVIYGNCFVVKLGMSQRDDEPDELLIAPSTGWTVEDGKYVWTSRSGTRYEFERWQIIHYRRASVDDSGFGVSMLEPLRMTLATEDAAQRFAVSAFRNGARPASILKSDQVLKPETAERLKAEIAAIHGGPDNAFKVAVLQQGLDWATTNFPNLDEAALINHRELTREEVAAVMDVPQPTIGILENANFASVDQLHLMLYQDSLGVWVTMVEETTQTDMVDLVPAWRGQFVEFDMNAVLRGDISARYRAYATAIQTGFKTPDEIRGIENDPPMADTQPQAGMLLFPLNLSPGQAGPSGAVGAQLAEDQDTDDNADDTDQDADQ